MVFIKGYIGDPKDRCLWTVERLWSRWRNQAFISYTFCWERIALCI